MTWNDLVSLIPGPEASRETAGEIGRLRYDSRGVEPGDVFFALRGEEADGHDFIGKALEAGAAGIVAESERPPGLTVPWLRVQGSRLALALAADAYYGHPSRDLRVVGVTGTNGKTTTAFLLHHLVCASWHRCGLIGTVRYDLGDETAEAERTTPESEELQRCLGRMRDAGCRAAVMEVSSHALAQERAAGVHFAVGIFLNLSQDHLDYHGNMESYFEAKARLGELLVSPGPGKKPALAVNIDDRYGERLVRRYEGKVELTTFGMGMKAEFRASDLRTGLWGTTFRLQARGRSHLVRLPLIGRFNVYNAMAALTGAVSLGLNFREAVHNLAEAPQVPGRMEALEHGGGFRVFVDYAHSPDALEKALETLRALDPKRLIVVFGCGGDRDRTKRPKMGAAAARLADYTVLTSDNPRGEDPAAILTQIEAGMGSAPRLVVSDREEALATALAGARPGDVVLIAGKGHEDYQETAGRRIPFDDRRVAARLLARRDYEITGDAPRR